MAAARNNNVVLIFLLVIIGYFDGYYCGFSLEELNAYTYVVDIVNTPVVAGRITDDGVMQVTSRFGQAYECQLPLEDTFTLPGGSSPTEKTDTQNVTKLLEPLKTSPCLVKTKHWWTYEFCYGQHVRQYHMENDGKIVEPAIFLGVYDSEFDWKNETVSESRNAKFRYHSQYYKGGSDCEVSGQRRSTEVMFVCEEMGGEHIGRVDEPETCSYVLTVHTPRLCGHPMFKPPSVSKPKTITCQPSLPSDLYEDYLKQEAKKKALEESRRERWLSNQEERLKDWKKKREELLIEQNLLEQAAKLNSELRNSLKPDSNMDKTGQVDQASKDLLESWRKIIKKGLEPSVDPTQPKANSEEVTEAGAASKMNQDEMGDLLSIMKKINQMFTDTHEELRNAEDRSTMHQIMQRFMKYYKEINNMLQARNMNWPKESSVSDSQTRKLFDKMRKTLEINLENEEGALNEERKVLDQLQSTSEPEGGATDNTAVPSAEIDANNDLKSLGAEDGVNSRTEAATEKLKKTMDGLMKDLDKIDSQEDQFDSDENALADFLKSLVNKPRKDPAKGNSGALTEKDRFNQLVLGKKKPRKLKPKNIDKTHMDFVERLVMDKLREAGMSLEGKKIEVKVLAPEDVGAGGDSKGDGKDEYQSILITFMGSMTEATEETERQKRLEDSYGSVWSRKRSQSERQNSEHDNGSNKKEARGPRGTEL